MNWPDHGSPHEAIQDQDPPHEAPPSDGAGGDPTDGSSASAEPAQPGTGPSPEDAGTASYRELRSEADAAAARWERPRDGDAISSTWRDPDEDAADGEVRPDEHPVSGGGPRSAEPAPVGTHEDAASRAPSADEGQGFTRPRSSPHTGSWEAGSDVPEGPVGGPPQGVGDPRALGHGESDGDETPPGFTGSGADPAGEPAPFHGEREAAPFHGEHVAPSGPEVREVGVEEPAAGDAPGSASDGDGLQTERPLGAAGPTAAVIEDTLAELEPDQRDATVICVANQKGGVGKTTTTVSLGAALAMEGAQVLVVDLDPQGNATTGLGLRAQEGAPSTYRVLVEQMDVEDATEPTAVRGLHVLPSSLDLAGAEIELVPAFSRENRLKQALDGVRDLYDVILIDCPPSLGLLTINALVAADQVLVPIQCEYYALEGLGQLMRTVKLVADSLNRGLGVGGVVLTMFDGRTNLSQQVVDEVRGYFGDLAYQTIVPRTVRLSEAPSYGQPIGVFDSSSRGARAYQRLAREVARRLDLELEAEEVSPLDRLLGPAPKPAPPEEGGSLPTDLGPGDVPGEDTTPEDHGTEEGTVEEQGAEPWDGPHHERYGHQPDHHEHGHEQPHDQPEHHDHHQQEQPW